MDALNIRLITLNTELAFAADLAQRILNFNVLTKRTPKSFSSVTTISVYSGSYHIIISSSYFFSVLQAHSLLTALDGSPLCCKCMQCGCGGGFSVLCCLRGIYYAVHMNQGTSICFPSHHR